VTIVRMQEWFEACGTFSLVGDCVPSISLVVSSLGVSQNYLGFVDASADTGLARRCTNLTFIERSLTLVHDAFTLVSRHVGLDSAIVYGRSPWNGSICVHCFLRSLIGTLRRLSSYGGQRRSESSAFDFHARAMDWTHDTTSLVNLDEPHQRPIRTGSIGQGVDERVRLQQFDGAPVVEFVRVLVVKGDARVAQIDGLQPLAS
jgi:hypothetical protein